MVVWPFVKLLWRPVLQVLFKMLTKFVCCLDDMEVVSDSEEAANYHQILEFFEMCANLITTLARWSACTAELVAMCSCRQCHVDEIRYHCFPMHRTNAGHTTWLMNKAGVKVPTQWRPPFLASLVTADPWRLFTKVLPLTSNIFKVLHAKYYRGSLKNCNVYVNIVQVVSRDAIYWSYARLHVLDLHAVWLRVAKLVIFDCC